MPRLFENLWVKIAALGLAFLLWLHVATEKNYQMQLALPLTQVELSGDLTLIEPPPESVLVVVTADGKSLLSNDWKKSGLRLVISQSRPGRFKGTLSTDNISLVRGERVGLVEVIAPREFNFNCDHVESRNVSVINRFVALPGEGFALGKADSLVPSEVTISGPRTAIRGIDFVETELDSLTGVRNDFSMKVALINPGAYGVKVRPDTITLFVNVIPVRTITLVNVPITIRNLPDSTGFAYYPRTVDLRLRGRPDLVDTLKATNIPAEADYNRADAGGFTAVKITLPDAVQILARTVDSVQIVVRP